MVSEAAGVILYQFFPAYAPIPLFIDFALAVIAILAYFFMPRLMGMVG